MKIIARCHPLLEALLPKPFLASAGLPEWFREMPSKLDASTLGGLEIRTLKHCPPFIDAMSSGLIIPLATDVEVKNGEVSWDWSPPIIEDAPISRSPVGVHLPEQATGTPLYAADRLILKFTNFWTFEVEAGWRLLFTHPFNRPELPFKTLTGIVDCHGFKDGFVHFPALLTDGFEGVIPKGTPIAQVLPLPGEKVDLDIQTMKEEGIKATREVQEALQEETGVYRKLYRK